MVRARVREDLERLLVIHRRAVLRPLDPEILALPHHDYPYRVIVTKQSWVTLAAILAGDIDYSNFKNAVTAKADTQDEGDARHSLYMKVWSVMHGAEKWLQDYVATARRRSKDQGSLGFWTRPQRAQHDPRSDGDMQALYDSRGWQEWLDEDEEAAVVSDLPEGTHDTFDLDDVIDNPTQDDIAAFEAAVSRAGRRRRGGKGR